MNEPGRKTILLVEDEPLISMKEIEIIKSFDYDVLSAYTGESAISIVSRVENINMILMDINLGRGIDGTETAKRILEKNDIPIVFLTSHMEEEFVDKIKGITRYGYVIKDSGIFVLKSSIEMAFELYEKNKALETDMINLKMLNERQNDFIEAIDNCGAYILTKDMEGNITYANKPVRKYFSATLDELKGKNIDCLIDKPNSEEMIKDDIKVLYEGKKIEKEETIGHMTMFTIKLPLISSDGTIHGLCGISMDISRRIKIEEERKRNEFLLNKSQQVAKLGHYDLNIVSGRWMNSEMLDAIFGIPKDYERTVEGWLRLVYQDDRIEIQTYLSDHVIRGRNTFDKEYRIRRYDTGEVRWVYGFGRLDLDAEGNPLRMFGIIQDINEKKITEEKRKEYEEYLSILLQSIGDGVIAADISGRITQINYTAEMMTGYSRGESADRLVSEIFKIIYPASGKNIMSIIAQVLLECNKVDLGNDLILKGIKGMEFRISGNASPVKDNAGNIKGVIIVFSDITDKYLIEQRCRESERQYKSLVSEMIQGIAVHDAIFDEKGDIVDFRFRDVNGSYEKLMGKSRDDIIGKTLKDILPENSDNWIEKYSHVEKTGEIFNCEYYSENIGRHYYVAAYRPRLDQVAVILTDISESKALQENLIHERNLFEKLVETSPLSIVMADRNGKISFTNMKAENMLDIKRNGVKEIYYNDPSWMITDINGEPFPEDNLPFSQVKRTLKPVYGVRHAVQTRSGKKLAISINASPIFDNKNEFDGIVAIIEDMTEKIQMEVELKEKEEVLQCLFDSTSDGIIIVDTSNFDIKTVNPSACGMYGYEAEEFLKLKVYDISAEPEQTKHAIINKIYDIPVHYHKKKNGTVFPVEISGGSFDLGGNSYFTSIIRDISVRKQSEDLLKKNQITLQLALENGKADSWEMNLETGALIYSEKWAHDLGYNKDDIPMTIEGITGIIHQDDVANNDKNFEDYINGLTAIYESECRVRKKNGDYIWALIRGQTVEYDGTGKPLRLIGVNFDITRMKRTDDRLKKMLLEKDILLKEVHHRIKNNMAALSGILKLHSDRIKNQEARTILLDAQSRIQSLCILYENLSCSDDFKEINVEEYMENLVDKILTIFPLNDVKIEKHLGKFKLNSRLLFPLGIIINELVTNALKYAFKDKSGGLLVITLKQADEKVVLEIEDNGNGMPDNIDFRNSSGFGLQLIGLLTQQIDGKIGIERGMGTKIILELEI